MQCSDSLAKTFYFALEVSVYETVSFTAAISPGIIASLSLTFMAAGYSSIFPNKSDWLIVYS